MGAFLPHKRRSRSRYLQLFACADGIGPSLVGICSARDEGQERMRKSPCEGCFVLHQSAHSICDGRRSPSSDPPRPIQCSTSDGSKNLCEDRPQLFEKSITQIHFVQYEMSRGVKFFSERKFQDHDPKIRLCLTHRKDFSPSF